MATFLHTHQTLRAVAARYEQDEALVQVIREYMEKEKCDFEQPISHYDPIEGTQPDAVRCGSGNRICVECGWCKFHCDCEKEN
jgi:hypothetical protein